MPPQQVVAGLAHAFPYETHAATRRRTQMNKRTKQTAANKNRRQKTHKQTTTTTKNDEAGEARATHSPRLSPRATAVRRGPRSRWPGCRCAQHPHNHQRPQAHLLAALMQNAARDVSTPAAAAGVADGLDQPEQQRRHSTEHKQVLGPTPVGV